MCYFLFVNNFPLLIIVYLTGELFGALRGRLYDSNKNLVMATLTTLGAIASAMGPAVEKSSKVCGHAINMYDDIYIYIYIECSLKFVTYERNKHMNWLLAGHSVGYIKMSW